MDMQDEAEPSVWPPAPDMQPTAEGTQKTCKVLTGSFAADAFSGLFVGAVPIGLLYFVIAILLFGDYEDNISGLEVRSFLALSTLVQCLVCGVCFKPFPAFRCSSLIAACLGGTYAVYQM